MSKRFGDWTSESANRFPTVAPSSYSSSFTTEAIKYVILRNLVLPIDVRHVLIILRVVLPKSLHMVGAHAASPGPVPVALGAASNFYILTKTGITDVRISAVKGNIGISPITGAADLLSCTEAPGNVYSVDAVGPNPCSLASDALPAAGRTWTNIRSGLVDLA